VLLLFSLLLVKCQVDWLFSFLDCKCSSNFLSLLAVLLVEKLKSILVLHEFFCRMMYCFAQHLYVIVL
jgi:hypothetical protein